MLVYPSKKALVIRPRNPQQLLTLIPTAKRMMVSGKEFVAVPHRLDEVRVLRNLGMSPPSPIRYHYHWSGSYTPFKAQMETSEFLTLNPRAYVLNGMGTGKTLAVLWAYDYLKQLGKVHKMLVVCPLSTMERTWADEIFRHFPHLDYQVLYGDRSRRLKLLQQDADIYIINHDGLAIIASDLANRPDIDIIIPDEVAQSARNASTDRWKIQNTVINKQLGGTRWCWGLTGTPTPNGPADAWAQCRLITPSTVPPYYGRFKDLVMKQVNNFLWVARPDAMEKVYEVMQPSIRFSREQCVDLPPCVFQTRHVDLTKEQRDAYKDMLTKLKFAATNGEVLAVNEAVKASKLVQIACLAAGTDVLTATGWKPIQTVTALDEVWDGIEWVGHDGLVDRGLRETIISNGVRMTPDHKVLTNNGWKEAKEIKNGNASEGFDRAKVRQPHRSYAEWFDHRDNEVRDVDLSMRLREHSSARKPKPAQNNPTQWAELRLQARPVEQDARTDGQGGVLYMDGVKATVREPKEQGLPTLWRKGCSCLRQVAGVVRELLGGYGAFIPQRAYSGPRGQQRSLFARELPVGYREGASSESAEAPGVRSSQGIPHYRGAEVNDLHSAGSTVQVYDLANCGPRNRFVVRGGAGQLMIVHNCGAAYDVDGNTVELDAEPRMKVVDEIVNEAEGKVIVFVPFVSALETVAAYLRKKGHIVGCIHGQVSKHERDVIFSDFQKGAHMRVIVAQPAAMSHGLTLTAANTIVWYAPIFSNDIYDQACARITRPGQTLAQLIVNIEGSPIELKTYERLKNKQKMQGILLSMVEDDRIAATV